MQEEPRILIVDDEPLMRISISDALKEEGYRVDETGAGVDGVRLLREGSYDIVITDLRLPDIDGIEVLKSCRRYSPGTAVLLITAHGSVDTAARAIELGASDCITKPFSLDELLVMIKHVLRIKALKAAGR